MGSNVPEVKNIFEMSREELLIHNQGKYLEFKEVYCTTNVPLDEIFNSLNVNKGDPTYRYINSNLRRENLQRPVNIFNEELEPLFQKYKKLFNETDLKIKEIYCKLGLKNYGKPAEYVRIRSKQEGLDGNARSWRIVPSRRKIVEPTAEELKKYEEKYQEYRDLFLNSNLTLKQVYEEINLLTYGQEYRYVKKRCKEDGLDGRERRKKIKIVKR